MSPAIKSIPPDLPELVRTTFAKAKADRYVTFYPTKVVLLKYHNTSFQLRFSPSLANKPKQPQNSNHGSKPFNPFENPPPQATVATLGRDSNSAYVLMLNKFAIVPEHFLLVTKEFKQQTHLLEPEDLGVAYACVQSYHAKGKELFVFFNSGEHSGASQPHRHLQCLPVDRMEGGLPDQDSPAKRWQVLADRLVCGAAEKEQPVPFATFAEKLSPDMDARALHDAYIRLYQAACAAAGADGGSISSSVPASAEAKISYNMAITRTAMVLCPRTAEGSSVHSKEGKEVGKVALNGTVLAGTALVKNEAEWDALRGDPAQLWDCLGRIGLRVRDEGWKV